MESCGTEDSSREIKEEEEEEKEERQDSLLQVLKEEEEEEEERQDSLLQVLKEEEDKFEIDIKDEELIKEENVSDKESGNFDIAMTSRESPSPTKVVSLPLLKVISSVENMTDKDNKRLMEVKSGSMRDTFWAPHHTAAGTSKTKKEHASCQREATGTGGDASKPEDQGTLKILSLISDKKNELDSDGNQKTGQARAGIAEFGVPLPYPQATTQHMNTFTYSSITPTTTPITASMTHDTSRNTPISRDIKTRDITSQNTPTPGQSNSAFKRQRTRRFTPEASFEASLEMQQREHKMAMESMRLEMEVKKRKLECLKQEDRNLKLEMEIKNKELENLRLDLQFQKEKIIKRNRENYHNLGLM